MFHRIWFCICMITASTSSALAEDMVLSGGAKWLVLASSESLVEVGGVVDAYGGIDDLRIVRVRNGRFALVSGPVVNFDLDKSKKNGSIKPDAFLDSGSQLLETVLVISQPQSAHSNAPPSPVATASRVDGCKTIASDAERLACYDATAGRNLSGPMTSNNSLPVERKAAPAPSPVSLVVPALEKVAQRQNYSAPQQAIVPTSLTLKVQRQDFEQDVMFDRIEFRVAFRNGWSQKIVGISHRFRILNAFGEVLHQGRDNLDIQIPQGTTKASDIFYSWEDNPFIPREVYDRLLPSVTNGTYKVELTVERAILDDGSVLEVARAS
ncbi:hypothetical protein [Rhizobium mongolense]|uniref:Uncharacterized protein n=2 Tax=Rhizobium mongolense TaxID=57676 RepID=A0ABR6IW70_9HYPH|nr:hypothetical protein [Rhizobium mongolense]MBB4232167.1 hypothetical protein [Rhizobium mongolense]TVZ63111.1 hypothetical protein BCL32_3228 [Rhizobium mongolense USDA 1844]